MTIVCCIQRKQQSAGWIDAAGIKESSIECRLDRRSWYRGEPGWLAESVAASKESVVLGRLGAGWVDALGIGGQLGWLFEGYTQALGSHGWGPLFHHHVPGDRKEGMYQHLAGCHCTAIAMLVVTKVPMDFVSRTEQSMLLCSAGNLFTLFP